MQTISIFSGAGGVTKTTSAVSLAATAAIELGLKTVLVDMDPRAAATTWTRADPKEPGLTVNAILADEDPTGWAEDIAVVSKWNDRLRVIPSEIAVEHREKNALDDMELRLKKSFASLDADLVVIDCPNRSGGLLLRSALLASDTVIYASDATEDGVAGVQSAVESVAKFKKSQADRGVPDHLHEAGVFVSKYHYGIVERNIEKLSVDDLEEISTVIYPLLPDQPFVLKCRRSGDWYGNFRQGQKLRDEYLKLARKVITV